MTKATTSYETRKKKSNGELRALARNRPQRTQKKYPDGFQEHLVCITDHRNNAIHVLHHETAESSYLIKIENYKAQIAHFLGNFEDFNQTTDEPSVNSD